MTTEINMELIRNEILNYTGLWGCECKCNLKIFENHTDCVVVFEERRDNRGTSVTNWCEHLANLVVGDLPLTKLVLWLEHYPGDDIYSQILFEGEPGKFHSPHWSFFCKKKDFEVAIGLQD